MASGGLSAKSVTRKVLSVEVIEQFVGGKDRDSAACEDLIVLTADFGAVIDGTTDKQGVDFNGRTGGSVAAEAVRDALLTLDWEAELVDLVDQATGLLVERVASAGVGIDPLTDDGPSASFVAFSGARREVWRVGDCSWRSGLVAHLGGKEVDRICAQARSALIQALLDSGTSQEELLDRDPGREMILPLLRAQHAFRNLDDPSSELAFGTIDGRPVPERFLEIWQVGTEGELVLASDGYPVLEPTLELTEAALWRELDRDPLRIGEHPTTKGVGSGQDSFDDRAYLRISI